MKIIINNINQTQKIAHILSKIIKKGDVIILDGDLGVGKTTLTKYLLQYLGIHKNVKSPTFNVVKEYKNNEYKIYHMDLYRIGDNGGAYDMGLEEYFDNENIIIIEWAKYIKNIIPSKHIKIKIKKNINNINDESREIEISIDEQREYKIKDKMQI